MVYCTYSKLYFGFEWKPCVICGRHYLLAGSESSVIIIKGFSLKNQNQTWKRMLPCNVHYNYCKMTLKLMIFFYIQHIDFWFLLQDQRKFMKELQQRILNQNCLLFSFKFVGLVNGFNALHTICLTFLFPYFLCKIDQ